MNTNHLTSEQRRASHLPAPPDRHGSRAGMNFATFDTLAHAEALKAFLTRHGIDAHVHDERKLQRYWFLARPGAGLHVRVPESSFAQVEELLKGDRDGALLMAKAVRCPSCHSFQVQFPSMTRNFILPTLMAQMGVLLGFMQRESFCEKCQFTWVQPHSRARTVASGKNPALLPGR